VTPFDDKIARALRQAPFGEAEVGQEHVDTALAEVRARGVRGRRQRRLGLAALVVVVIAAGGSALWSVWPTDETITVTEAPPSTQPDASPAAEPSLELERTRGLRDGDRVPFTVAGMTPNSQVSVDICAAPGRDLSGCDVAGSAVELTTDAAGVAEGTLDLRQWIFTRRGFVDCSAAESECAALLTGDEGAGPTVPVSFEATAGKPQPTLSIAPPGPYGPSEEVVRLEARELPANVDVAIAICEAGVDERERHCVTPAAGVATTDSGGALVIDEFPLILTHPAAGLDCQAAQAGCEVAWYPPAVGAPAYVAESISVRE
jgi:hypothetical protein